jgi:OHCU decarboxylase
VLALADVNALDAGAFLGAFGTVFEHSPWIAEDAWRRRPFASPSDLEAAFEAAVMEAPPERQLALLRAHPELAGRETRDGELTAESAREQGRAGLDRLAAGELQALQHLNAAYRRRFGFPLIVCVREHTPESILAWGRERLANAPEQERVIALGEVAKIGRLRLRDVVGGGGA